MEVIARLERQIDELNLLVSQYHAASQNHPPNVAKRGPFHPCIRILLSFIKEIILPHFSKLKAPHTLIQLKILLLEDAMIGLRGFDSSQSVRYEELCTFPEVELPPDYKIPKFENIVDQEILSFT